MLNREEHLKKPINAWNTVKKVEEKLGYITVRSKA